MVLRDVNETSEIGQIGDKDSAKQHYQIVNMFIPFFVANGISNFGLMAVLVRSTEGLAKNQQPGIA